MRFLLLFAGIFNFCVAYWNFDNGLSVITPYLCITNVTVGLWAFIEAVREI